MSESAYRSPADLLRVVVAAALVLALLLVGWLFEDAIHGFLSDVVRGVAQLPSWLVTGAIVLTRIVTAVVLVAGFLAVVARRRLRLLVMAAVGGVGGALFARLFNALLGAEPTAVDIDSSLGYLTDPLFPSEVGLAAAAGAVTACAPWLSRRWRRVAWLMIVGLAVSRFLTAPTSLDSATAVVTGWFAGAIALLVTGGPMRRPTTDAVRSGLAGVGLELARLEPADVDARGSTPYFGATTDDRGVFVKVLGTDERDADTLFRLYRRLQPRDLGDEKPFSSLRRTVEHEALVSLTAASFGIPTPNVLAFATVEPNAYVLAYESVRGRSLDRIPAEELTDELVAGLWEHLRALRAHRIAHRDLRLANLFRTDDGGVMLIDFGFSELAASDLLLATDLAELLTSLALVIGPERSLACAGRVLGPQTLASAAPRLKPFALSGATRTGLKHDRRLMDELRARIV